MLIDWFTFSAQIVNFLLLVWVLKKFLYKPVLNAMEDRQKSIDERIEDAKERASDTDELKEKLEKERESLRKEKEEKLATAEREAKIRKEEIVQQAREEVNELKRKWSNELEQDKEEFLQELKHKVREQTIEVCRKALSDLADADMNARIVKTFIEKAGKPDEDQGKNAIEKLRTADSDRVTVRTAFSLSERAEKEIESFIKDEIQEEDISVEFEVAQELIGGLELQVDGERIDWNVSAYLSALDSELETKLSQESKS